MPPNILLALQLIGPGIELVRDVISAISTASSDGVDLTDAQMAELVNKKQAADDLAEIEASRLRKKFGIV